MSDVLDKLIVLGMGLEKKAKETLSELQDLGEAEKKSSAAASEGAAGEEAEGEDLSSKKKFENKLVDNGVKLITDLLSSVTECKDKLDSEISGGSQRIVEKLSIATKDDLDIIMEMTRVAREKVEALEKRVEELEKKG